MYRLVYTCIYLCVFVHFCYGNIILDPSSPTRRQGCSLQITCTDTSAASELTWRDGNTELMSGGDIQIENNAIPSGGYMSILTFLKLMNVGQTSYRCIAPSGSNFALTVIVIEGLQIEEIQDLNLNRYVEGQGYFIPCIIQSCIWPVEIEWKKGGDAIFSQTLEGEETGELNKRAGLLDTQLDTESAGTYTCTASVQATGVANAVNMFRMSGVTIAADL